MRFVTYALNCEDVLLWRALHDAGPGFYVDAGAGDPVLFSATQAFYERGWRGFNIEPANGFFKRLCRLRPADRNVQAVAGEADGRGRFFEVLDTARGAFYSTADEALAHGHAKAGRRVRAIDAATIRLDTVLQSHAGPIHFLKIATAGAERAVLEGVDLAHHQPWIVVVRSAHPLTLADTTPDWQQSLLQSGYSMAAWDGLNHYYVLAERGDLLARLQRPVCALDDFVSAEAAEQAEALAHAGTIQESLRQEIAVLSAELQRVKQQAREEFCAASGHHDRAVAALQTLEQQLLAVYNSRLWRWSIPPRVMLGRLRQMLIGRPAATVAIDDTMAAATMPPTGRMSALMHDRLITPPPAVENPCIS